MVGSLITGIVIGVVAYCGFDADGQIAFLMGLIAFYGELCHANTEIVNKNIKRLYDKVVDSQ